MERYISVYEAKAKFSELLRLIEKGVKIVITRHGKPIATLNSVERTETQSLVERISELTERGLIAPAANPSAEIKPITSKPGVLKRFLENRD